MIKSGSDRGLLDEGSEITSDGHYDVKNRRLCNIADPQQSNNAIPVKVVQSIVKQGTQALYQITTSLRDTNENNFLMIGALQSELKSHIKNHSRSTDTLHELATCNAEVIYQLDVKLSTLEKFSINLTYSIQNSKYQLNGTLRYLEKNIKTGEIKTYLNSEIITILRKRLKELGNGKGGSNGGR